MGASMAGKFIGACKGLAAPLPLAHKRLLTGVGAQVRLQVAGFEVSFPTALIVADVRPPAAVVGKFGLLFGHHRCRYVFGRQVDGQGRVGWGQCG